MVEIDDNVLAEVGDKIRDTINWVAVFEEEYDLPKEVVDRLRQRLEEIAGKLA